MDQNRDGFIDKNDLRDTFAALGMSLASHRQVPCPTPPRRGGRGLKKANSLSFPKKDATTMAFRQLHAPFSFP